MLKEISDITGVPGSNHNKRMESGEGKLLWRTHEGRG